MSVGKRPNKEVAGLLPYLGEAFESFALRGIWLFHTPVEEILYGFAFDPRPGHDGSRWLHAFGLPLSVPATVVSLSFGKRVPDGRARGHAAFPVRMGTEAELRETARVVETEGIEELSRWKGVRAFRRSLARPHRDFDIHRQGAAAVLAARDGDLAEAARAVDHCETYVQAHEAGDLAAIRAFDPEATAVSKLRPWEPEVLRTILPLREPCRSGDDDAVKALLDGWRSYTISKLGIEDICVP